MILIHLLILFFILLFGYQVFLASNSVFEGLENQQKEPTVFQPYDTNNPNNAFILAQQNAGNIIVLKQQLDSMLGLNKQVKDLSDSVSSLQDQVQGLAQANQQYTSSKLGTTPPTITGTIE